MIKEPKAEIISVGTELLLGQIVNSNAAWMSEKLASRGVSVFYHSVVGDNLDRLAAVFQTAANRSDIVFITGGLGPTEDDLTREAFQKMTGLKIVEDKKTMDQIHQFFSNSQKSMSPNNRKQARVFEGSTVFNNSVGIAPGIVQEYQDTYWIFMPGVPREMKAIMSEHILPYIEQLYPTKSIIYSRMLRFIGIGESQLEHELQLLISNQTNPTIAPLATEGEVGLRLSAKAESKELAEKLIDELEQKIASIVGDFLYGHDEVTLDQKVFGLLKGKGLTLASAESLTGGAFSAAIVKREGSSSVFQGSATVYQPVIKEKVLGISQDLIEDHGTVSEACAEAMAQQVKKHYLSDIGISFTGVAGPDSIEGKEVGTVYISICDPNDQCHTYLFHFNGDRETIQRRVVKKGLELLFRLLKE